MTHPEKGPIRIPRKPYDWKRYWIPRSGTFSFDSDGFLLPPYHSTWGFLQNDAVGFDDLVLKPCLVLLGEPGIGKSFALNDAREQAERTRTSAVFLTRNLGAYGSEQRLLEDIFISPEFINWSKTGGELHVFLDSFDECLIRLDNVAALLGEQLKRLNTVHGLFFRIASRTAEWRRTLEDSLGQIWKQDDIAVYELCPLTKEQVLSAARENILDPDKFIREVINGEVVSFAIKPLTLDLLLRIWKTRGGSLPPTQREIYEIGCLELCSESNSARDTPQLRRRLNPHERLAVASQIAAATVFCKRSAIWTGQKPSEMSETDVSRSALSNGTVVANGRETSVTDAAVRETLDTGLFTARGADRLGWAHQTYAEYLAARYVREQRFSPKQILDLIQHANDPERKLVPQLHEVSAWIASDNNIIFQRLLDSEPDILLRSDVATANDSLKEQLVESLLIVCGNPDFRPDWWNFRKRYRKLNHARLTVQLRKVLQGGKYSHGSREEAIHMAESCELRVLYPLLLELALNEREHIDVREEATTVISRCSDDTLISNLKPLALGQAGADLNDRLRGLSLEVCWPNVITADELFSTLTNPKGKPSSTYSHFVRDNLAERLSPADLPIALRWAENQPENHDPSDEFHWLIFRIIGAAIPHLDKPLILDAFARALLSRLRKHDFATSGGMTGLPEALQKEPGLNLKIVEASLPAMENPSDDTLYITRWGMPLLNMENLDWLLGRLRTEPSPDTQKKLCYLVSWVFFPKDAKSIDAIVSTAEKIPLLSEIMSHWFKPAELGSEAALKTRDYFQQQQQWTKDAEDRKQKNVLTPPPSKRLLEWLERSEDGDLNAWWQACAWAEIDENGKYTDKYYHIDLRDLPGWKEAAAETKARLVLAAARYVTACEPNIGVWFKWKNKTYRPALAGIRALLLLANEAFGTFETLSSDVWSRWLPAIWRIHHYNENNAYRVLLKPALQKAPEQALTWLLKTIDQENRESENLWVLQKLPDEKDAVVGEALLAMVKSNKLKPQNSKQILELLIRWNVSAAIDILRTWLPRKISKNKRRREKARFAAQWLLKNGERQDWKKIRAFIDADTEFGKSLIESISHTDHYSVAGMAKTLSESDISALWAWIHKEYPVAGDPPERSAGMGGSITTRWAVADLRDGLLSHLANMGTVESCQELARITKKHPEYRPFLATAKDQMRRNTWQPPIPEVLFKLSQNHRNRLVQNGDQLLEIVCDSIRGLQEKLHGETPAAKFLWDKDRPKDEESVSDWVKLQLEEILDKSGIILNREVQIHTKERTDIHVDAVTRDAQTRAFDRIKVIIETKGCWNPELKEAMESQLAKRYLEKNNCHHGVYLVGWFLCEAWSKKDSRRRNVKFRTLNELHNYLANQSTLLSTRPPTIQAVVLDACLPKPKTKGKTQSTQRR